MTHESRRTFIKCAAAADSIMAMNDDPSELVQRFWRECQLAK
jgi:hypothetical protein